MYLNTYIHIYTYRHDIYIYIYIYIHMSSKVRRSNTFHEIVVVFCNLFVQWFWDFSRHQFDLQTTKWGPAAPGRSLSKQKTQWFLFYLSLSLSIYIYIYKHIHSSPIFSCPICNMSCKQLSYADFSLSPGCFGTNIIQKCTKWFQMGVHGLKIGQISAQFQCVSFCIRKM